MLFEIGVLVAEPATFGRSTRGIGLGIKPQQHFAATKGGQRQELAFVGQQSEIWRGIAGFQHGVPHLKAIVAAGRMKI